MKQNRTYKQARRVCGPCLGRLTTDDVYSRLNAAQLRDLIENGYAGLLFHHYGPIGWAGTEFGYTTNIFQHGAYAPTAVEVEYGPPDQSCSGAKDGFYWITPGTKTPDEYLAVQLHLEALP
jgi:hypothetical protein